MVGVAILAQALHRYLASQRGRLHTYTPSSYVYELTIAPSSPFLRCPRRCPRQTEAGCHELRALAGDGAGALRCFRCQLDPGGALCVLPGLPEEYAILGTEGSIS